MVFVLLWLAYFAQHDALDVHTGRMGQDFLFEGRVVFHGRLVTRCLYPFACQWVLGQV